ncbi:hypothetical protein [Chlorogloeopsis sp. ULAP02]|uniref:hypothetical protein n=1 Tax=Chlorogloeopsis sp. ULAP02 TaxID=3107926 RepID=UPI003135B7A0
MWLNGINHIQVTSSPEAEDAMLFFYSKVLGLTEIDKPKTIKDNGGAWYVLGDIQIHVSIEKILITQHLDDIFVIQYMIYRLFRNTYKSIK